VLGNISNDMLTDISNILEPGASTSKKFKWTAHKFDTVEGFKSNITLNVLIALKCHWLSPPKK
jgi:hypothetical protein